MKTLRGRDDLLEGVTALKLTDLPNIGPVLAEHLRAAGIETVEQLRELGAEGAFERIRRSAKPDVCLHELEALAGAVAGIRKSLLPPERKAALKAWFYRLTEEEKHV